MSTWRDYRLTKDYQERMMTQAAHERLVVELSALRQRRGAFRSLMTEIGRLLATWGTALQTRYGSLDLASLAQQCRTEDSLTAELERINVC
jgi:hypothetical protein